MLHHAPHRRLQGRLVAEADDESPPRPSVQERDSADPECRRGHRADLRRNHAHAQYGAYYAQRGVEVGDDHAVGERASGARGGAPVHHVHRGGRRAPVRPRDRRGAAGLREGQARPGTYNYASSGNGTIIHLAGELFVDAAGVDVKHIPYKGTGPMVAELIGGQVELEVVALPAVQGHLKSGALRPIGVMGQARVTSLPDLPTHIEQGFPEADIAGWFAVIGPPKMSAAQVKLLNAAVIAAFATPEVREAMAKQENEIHPSTPEAAAEFFCSEHERCARLVKRSDIKLD